jgi:OmpA-OmpF porin, OOP family
MDRHPMEAPVPDSSDQTQANPGSKLVRRPPGLLLLLSVLLVPALLTAVLVVVRADAIEEDLRERSLDALADQGFAGVEVELSGRDATVRAPVGTDAGRVREIVAGVDGVRVVDADDAATTATASPTEPTSPTESPSPTAPPAAPFSISRIGDMIEVTGSAPDATTKSAILDAAKAQAGTVPIVDRITVDPNAKPPKTADLANLVKVAAAVQGDVSVNFDGETITLTGQVADDATRATAETEATAAVPGAVVENQLRVGTVPPHQANCRVAQSKIIQILAGNKITFQPETADLTPASRETIAKVAAVLNACSGVRIEVAGHTDTQGNPAASLPLSQRRAGAVKVELVRLGVFANRIRAVGFGESQPIANNTTVAGRTANRRVEIKVL